MNAFNEQQRAAVRALHKAMLHARETGLYLVADSNAPCLRVTTKEEAMSLEDMSTIKRTIPVDDGCGSATSGSRHPDWGNA